MLPLTSMVWLKTMALDEPSLRYFSCIIGRLDRASTVFTPGVGCGMQSRIPPPFRLHSMIWNGAGVSVSTSWKLRVELP